MIAVDLGVRRVEQALRLVRALGAHRYVAGRLHLTHAFALGALGDDADAALADARDWARATLTQGDSGELDLASRDERLWRRCSDAEVAALLEVFWTPGSRAEGARAALRTLLDRHGFVPGDQAPFDESVEDLIHPLAVDAGWELLPLAELDPERHRGAIAAFGDPMAFEVAVYEDETTVPSTSHLYELPAIGPVELLRGARDDGTLSEPLVVWAQGNEVYVDYVLRGVARAAKLDLEAAAG
jgi:hypothetical protein